jgi:hypothetical protein
MWLLRHASIKALSVDQHDIEQRPQTEIQQASYLTAILFPVFDDLIGFLRDVFMQVIQQSRPTAKHLFTFVENELSSATVLITAHVPRGEPLL